MLGECNQVYIAVGYNSYTSLDTMDEFRILGVFTDIKNAKKFVVEYLSDTDRDYDKMELESYYVN